MGLYGARFLKQAVRFPFEVGAIAASGKYLAEVITNAAEVAQASVVVEYGPGTGPVTEVILRKLQPGATFFAIEVIEEFVVGLRTRFPNLTVYHDSAANIRTYLEKHGVPACDTIVSGLPWTAFKESLQDELLDATLGALRKGGRFTTFMYLQSPFFPSGKRFVRKMYARFSTVDCRTIVWRNVLPAVVFSALK
jgi:phosphatidylethanolamine/phosphatidyl-N-methylethanolamine N-methyltransferase